MQLAVGLCGDSHLNQPSCQQRLDVPLEGTGVGADADGIEYLFTGKRLARQRLQNQTLGIAQLYPAPVLMANLALYLVLILVLRLLQDGCQDG